MKKQRLFTALSLIINALIVYLTVDGVIYYFRSDVIKDEALLESSGWICMRYFTTLSNIFVAVAAAVLVAIHIINAARDTDGVPKWALTLKYVATAAVTLTFLTVVFFLAPIVALGGDSYFKLFENNQFILHFLTPVLAIVSFIFFDGGGKLPFKSTLLTIAPTVAYSFAYIPMVAIIKAWPDFYWLTFGEKYYLAPISVIVMYGVTYGIGVLERYLHNKANK